jgi:DNA topoisomerase VI subunit B
MHIRAHKRNLEEEKKKSYIERYIPHIGIALREILGFPEKTEVELTKNLREILERTRTQ